MSFFCYLRRPAPHDVQYFCAVTERRGVLGVAVAWGRGSLVSYERTYTGGKSGAFDGERDATAYARAVVKSKIDDGYTMLWSSESPRMWPRLDNGKDHDGEEPSWWHDVTAPSGTAARDDHRLETPKPKPSLAAPKPKPSLAALKRKLREIDDDTPEKPRVKGSNDKSPVGKTSKESGHGIKRRPRIQITPRR